MSEVTMLHCKNCGEYYQADRGHMCSGMFGKKPKLTIVEDTEPITYDKVTDYIDDLPISRTDINQLRSMIAELVINTRKQEQDFVERKCKELGIDYIQIYTCNSAE